MLPKGWLRVFKTALSTTRPFGAMFRRYRETFSKGMRRWLLAVSHASESVTQESGKDSKTTEAACGERCLEPFARYDRATCSWKMFQRCLFEGDILYSETLPRAGTMRSGLLYPSKNVAVARSGIGYSSWPTIRAQEDDCTPEMNLQRQARARERYEAGEYGSNSGPPSMNSLSHVAQVWPGVTASPEAPNLNSNQVNGPTSLGEAAMLWTTPQAHDYHKRSKGQTQGGINSAGNACLATDAEMWPTMTHRANEDCESERNRHTPCTAAAAAEFMELWETNQEESPTGPQAHPTQTLGEQHSKSGQTLRLRLNARFVEWLQGLPIGWSALAKMNCEDLAIWLSRSRVLLQCLRSGNDVLEGLNAE